jgi:hypothetical protein
MNLEVQVLKLNGQRLTFNGTAESTAWDIKMWIYDRDGYRPENLRLGFQKLAPTTHPLWPEEFDTLEPYVDNIAASEFRVIVIPRYRESSAPSLYFTTEEGASFELYFEKSATVASVKRRLWARDHDLFSRPFDILDQQNCVLADDAVLPPNEMNYRSQYSVSFNLTNGLCSFIFIDVELETV